MTRPIHLPDFVSWLSISTCSVIIAGSLVVGCVHRVKPVYSQEGKQAFEDGAARKDARGSEVAISHQRLIPVSGGINKPVPVPRISRELAGIKPGRHLQALAYDVSAYAFGCILPRSGPEPKHKTRAADGSWPVPGSTVAADWSLHPQGSEIIVEELGYRTVTDRGFAIKGRKLDLFMSSCAEARKFGRRRLKVWAVPRTSSNFSKEKTK